MNHLHRELAPITPEGWAEIEDEANQSLKRMLAARKLFNFEGPFGWDHSCVNLGSVERLKKAPVETAGLKRRKVQPLIEAHIPFEVDRDQLEAATRGAPGIDVDSAGEAARKAALLEDSIVFNGDEEAGIMGVTQSTEHDSITIGDEYNQYPALVAEACERLRRAGVDGPYAIALGPRCYTELSQVTEHGYPVMNHIRNMLSGPIVWAPGVDGAVVMSMRGDDFVLHVGQDFSIGYSSHDEQNVQLYIQSTFTSFIWGPEAAVVLRHQN